MTYKLSPHALNLYRNCERCFYLSHNENIKRPYTPFPSLPNGIDRVLKDYFDAFREAGELPPELQELKKVQLFPDKQQLDAWRTMELGLTWNDAQGNNFKGLLDDLLVDTESKDLIVFDFKTKASVKKVEVYEMYQDQLNMYTFLLSKNGFPVADHGYLLMYAPEKVLQSGVFAFSSQLVKVNVSVQDAEELCTKAVEVLESKTIPKAGTKCGHCAWTRRTKDI